MGIQRDIGQMKGDVGYIKGKITGVCREQSQQGARIDRMEARCSANHDGHHPQAPDTTPPVPVEPGAWVNLPGTRKAVAGAGGGVLGALILSIIGYILSRGGL